MGMVSPVVLTQIYETWCDLIGFDVETPASLRGFRRLKLDGYTVGHRSEHGKKPVLNESASGCWEGIGESQTAVDQTPAILRILVRSTSKVIS